MPGLFVRCRAQSKTFRLERRIDGTLVKKTLAARTMKEAKAAAMSTWAKMKPRPAAAGVLTLEMAIEQFLERERQDGPLAAKTKSIHRYNAERYLDRWKGRSLADLGNDRDGIRRLQQQITKDHGRSTSNQVMRLLAAVYRWHQDTNQYLPEWPRTVAIIHKIPARDWGYSPEELKARYC